MLESAAELPSVASWWRTRSKWPVARLAEAEFDIIISGILSAGRRRLANIPVLREAPRTCR